MHNRGHVLNIFPWKVETFRFFCEVHGYVGTLGVGRLKGGRSRVLKKTLIQIHPPVCHAHPAKKVLLLLGLKHSRESNFTSFLRQLDQMWHGVGSCHVTVKEEKFWHCLSCLKRQLRLLFPNHWNQYATTIFVPGVSQIDKNQPKSIKIDQDRLRSIKFDQDQAKKSMGFDLREEIVLWNFHCENKLIFPNAIATVFFFLRKNGIEEIN